MNIDELLKDERIWGIVKNEPHLITFMTKDNSIYDIELITCHSGDFPNTYNVDNDIYYYGLITHISRLKLDNLIILDFPSASFENTFLFNGILISASYSNKPFIGLKITRLK